MVGVEWLSSGRVAVIDAGDFACAAHVKMNKIVREWAQISIFVLNSNRDVGEVITIGMDYAAIGDQLDASRGTSGGNLQQPHMVYI